MRIICKLYSEEFFRGSLYITIYWSVCLIQGRGILYTVICSFMKVLGFNMYTVHLDTLGIIHDCKWIADLYSFNKRKAGPFLTLPQVTYTVKRNKNLF